MGLSARKRGWTWLPCVLGRLRGGSSSIDGPRCVHGDETTDWIGDSGNGVSSGDVSGKGPSSGFAGETGRLPGIGSRRITERDCVGEGMYSSSMAEVSQFSKSSWRTGSEYRLGVS